MVSLILVVTCDSLAQQVIGGTSSVSSKMHTIIFDVCQQHVMMFTQINLKFPHVLLFFAFVNLAPDQIFLVPIFLIHVTIDHCILAGGSIYSASFGTTCFCSLGHRIDFVNVPVH